MSPLASIPIDIVPQTGPAQQISDISAPAVVATLINILLGGAGVISFIYLLLGGWNWIMAGGDKDSLDKARRKVSGSLVGLAIVFSSYALIYLMRTFFGVDLIRVNIEPI
jgi:hypothetical protein